MASWADIAGCYRWMHDRCEKISARSNLLITIPVIILSTLTGSANFMMQSVVGSDTTMQKYAQIGIGSVSIFTGILTTLGNFFRYAQVSEAHRVASISWGKFNRQIAVELRLNPNERIDSMDFLKICRVELDRLIEQSPPIPDKVILDFEVEFKDRTSLTKPDISHGLDHTKIFIDTENRMKKMVVDATVMLKQKKKVWHTAMMPDVDAHMDKRVNKLMTDISGNYFAVLQGRVNELEELVRKQAYQAKQNEEAKQQKDAGAHIRSFSRHLRGRSPTVRPKLTLPVTNPKIQEPPTPLAQKQVDHTVPQEVATSSSDLISALIEVKEEGKPSFPEASFGMSLQ